MEDRITLSHGSGGVKSEELIKIFLHYLGNYELNRLNDSAYVQAPGNRVVFSTDSFVVKPLFFPGGDIGKLSVYGTINDLSVMKAKPKVLSLAFIIEEGFKVSDLKKVLLSIKYAALDADVKVVTGDTKVVGQGKADGLYITTSGIGELLPEAKTRKAKPGDAIIISNSIAEHGLAVLSARKGFKLSSNIKSDTKNLFPVVYEIVAEAPDSPFIRDATRGGIAMTLNELAEKQNVGLTIYEDKIPIKEEVAEICETLDLDPFNIANEGVLIATVPAKRAEAIVSRLRKLDYSKDAEIIGFVSDDFKKTAILEISIGGKRIINKPTGEILPRIC